MTQGKSPFDDASGQQLLGWLGQEGGAPVDVNSLVGAGTTIDDATPAPLGHILVGQGAANSGIRLSASTKIGQLVVINSLSSNATNIYPPNAESKFDGNADGDPYSLAANGVSLFFRFTSTLWVIY